MPKKRILCVGFSVTEMGNSYVPEADRISRTSDLPFEFHRCGLGGVGVETLAYLVDEILDMHAGFRQIVFEIATGAGRTEFNTRRLGINDLALIRCVQEIANSALRRGLSIGFFNLPRLDVDYGNDILELAIFAIGSSLDVPVYSLAYRSFINKVDLVGMLPDKVHVNESGAEYYGNALIHFCSKGLSEPGTRPFVERKLYSIGLANASTFPLRRFERSGYSVDVTSVPAGEAFRWSSDNDIEFRGITFLSGPSTGKIRVSVDDVEVAIVQTYDQYCYYERFNSAFITPTIGRSLTLEVLAETPVVVLLKGTPLLGPRLIGFGHVLFASRTGEQ